MKIPLWVLIPVAVVVVIIFAGPALTWLILPTLVAYGAIALISFLWILRFFLIRHATIIMLPFMTEGAYQMLRTADPASPLVQPAFSLTVLISIVSLTTLVTRFFLEGPGVFLAQRRRTRPVKLFFNGGGLVSAATTATTSVQAPETQCHPRDTPNA